MIRKIRYLAKQLIINAHSNKKLMAQLQQIVPNNQDNRGYTIAHYVAEIGNANLLSYLHKNGADMNITDHYGQLPLHLAARKGNLKAVVTLLKMTSNVDAQDRYGNTALHIAAKHGDITIVKKLIRAGASANIVNEHGHTVMAIAEENEHKAVVKILSINGAKKIRNIAEAVIEAYFTADARVRLILNLFTLIMLGGAIIATFATSGQLWHSILAAMGASMGLAMIALEKPYRYVRLREKYKYNKVNFISEVNMQSAT